MIRLLIHDYELDKNTKDNYGATLLHYAALGGHPGVIRLLIHDYELDKSAKDNYGATLLHFAALGGHPEAIRLLIDEHGLNRNAKTNDGRTALHFAAVGGHPDVIRQLIDEHGLNRNAKTNDGRTALHCAAFGGHPEVIRLLIEYGLDKNAKTNDGRTALHRAAALGNVEVAQQLISAGADREAREQIKGSTPLQLAIVNGQKEMVRMLVQQGARVDSQNKEGQNALHIIAKSFPGDEVEAFAFEFDAPEILASWQIKDHKGRTPADMKNLLFLKGLSAPLSENGTAALIAAAKTGNSQQIKVLLKAGVPSGQTDSWGWIPLHYAVKHRQQDVIHLLAGEQTINALTPVRLYTTSRTPLHMANADKNFPMAKALLEHQASPAIANNQGVTPLHQMLSIYSAEQLQTLHPLLRDYLPGLIKQPDDQKRTPIQTLRNRADISVELVTLFSQELPSRPPEPAKQQVRAGIQCAISLDIARDPVQALPCGHWFDRDNINRWQQRQSPGSQNQCPACKQAITKQQPFYGDIEVDLD